MTKRGAKAINMSYADDETIEEKVTKIARMSMVRSVILKKAAQEARSYSCLGHGAFPSMCAKTQFSFSEDQHRLGVARIST